MLLTQLFETDQITKKQSPQFGHMGAVQFSMLGGSIDVVPDSKYSPTKSSVVEFIVDEDTRGQGIGTQLLQRAMRDYPELGGQVSSAASLKVFYKLGFRNPELPDGTFEDYLKSFQKSQSIFMRL